MTCKKFSILLLLALLLSFSSGCATTRIGDRQHTNFLGIYERETHAFTDIPHCTIALRRVDIDPGAEFTGNRVSLLWGLFTYYDY